jgi:hypothetical protein
LKQIQNASIQAVTFVVLCAVLSGLPGGSGMQAAWAGTDLQWTWMKGSSTANAPGTYGTVGIVAPANTPGQREEPVSWTDPTGALWLFGGSMLNDLWKYDRGTGYWTWMKGAKTDDQPGTYGTYRTPAATNTPGGRMAAVSWTDSSGALWLFGGSGYDNVFNDSADLNDLWKYDRGTGNWAWMKGSQTRGQAGTYGTPGVPAVENTPGARSEAAAWTDPDGKFWLFGGSMYNDLWKYDPDSGNWAWMKGASTANQSGVYGTQGVPDAANTPGARNGAVSWTDPAGALWLFGGSHNYGDECFNDLWKYDRSTGNWTWMKGANILKQPGIYGTPGTPAAENTPGARAEATAWTDALGNLWLFGGNGYDGTGSTSIGALNDLWKYDRSTGNWTWVKGTSLQYQQGVYGVLGTPAAANTPGGRMYGLSWTDPSGALWLFGGYGADGTVSGAGDLNDLWRIALPADTIAPTGTIVINANRSATNTQSVTLALTWADAGGPVARMRFSNDGSTWSAWQELAAALPYTLPGTDGHKTVRVQYLDKANNRSAVFSDYIRLDTTPPTGAIIINNGASTTTTRSVTLGLAWSAGTGAGVTRMRFSDNGSTWTPWELPSATRAYALPAGLGYHTVRVQYLDGANNYSLVYNDFIKLVSP